MGTIIAVTSGKGGTGKTTSVGAIASCLAALGHKTLCLDADVGLKNLDITLGLSDFAVLDFNDVIKRRISLEDALIEHPRIKNLYFLTAPALLRPEDIELADMQLLISQIKEKFEYCLIDSPAGVGAGFRLAVTGCDMAIVVTTGDTSSLRDGQRVVQELHGLGLKDIRLLVNRIRPKLFRRIKATVDDIIDTVGVRLLGLVAEDEAVMIAANLETPLVLYEDKNAAMQYLRIARRIIGEDIPIKRL